jgi:hypothetical protein
MKWTKKRIAITCVVAVVLLMFFALKFVFRINVGFNADKLLDNIDEYTAVAQFCYDDYSKYDTDILTYYFDDEDNTITCPSKGYEHTLEATQEIIDDFLAVDKVYYVDKQNLYAICVYDGFVSFFNINGYASLVYSVNDKKPKYVSSSSNDYDIFLFKRKLCDNWYFVSKTESLI